MSLSLTSLDEAFNMRANTDQIHENVGLQAEKAYIKVDTIDNKNINYLQTKNYRTTQYTKNSNYLFKKDQVYDLQGIHDGKGPGRNVMVDDQLTRGNVEPRPNDKLAEKVSFIRRIDFLPSSHREVNHNKFLVNTTLSTRPQTSFCPQFDVQGVNCRHYGRKTDKYFKDKFQRQ